MKNYKPCGIQSLVPFLSLVNVPKFIKFAKDFFNAEIISETKNKDGVVFYATIKLDDTVLFVIEAENNEQCKSNSLYFYVEDTDIQYKKAMKLGMISIMEPKDQYYGDRNAIVIDEWGNQWCFATTTENLSTKEIEQKLQTQSH